MQQQPETALTGGSFRFVFHEQVTRQPATVMDLLPTLAELAAVDLPPGIVLDGQSLVRDVLRTASRGQEVAISNRQELPR